MNSIISSSGETAQSSSSEITIPEGSVLMDFTFPQNEDSKISEESIIEKSPEASDTPKNRITSESHEAIPNSPIKVDCFLRANSRNEHFAIEVNELFQWACSNTDLKNHTQVYKKFLIDNPNATKRQKSEQKLSHFPATTFAGTFTGTANANEISEMSGLIVIDLDHIENIMQVCTLLGNDIYTHFLFYSPSGDGLKLIVRHDLRDPLKWEYLFQELQEYYLINFNLVIDPSGKDISRMCYIPFIEKLYRKNDSLVWKYTGKFENPQNPPQKETLGKKESPENGAEESKVSCGQNAEVKDQLFHECLHMSTFLMRNKINLTEEYKDWISYGFSLCSFSESGREIFHNISSVSTKYDRDECDQQFDRMLDSFNGDKSGINKYLTKAKEAIARLINQKIKNEIILPPIDMYGKLPRMLSIPLIKYQDVQKFMALLAGIGYVSAILPNLKFRHYGTYEYEANLFIWIIAKQSSGKNVLNDMQKICRTIEDNIERDYTSAYKYYKEKERQAKVDGTTFEESKPIQKTLFLGADITKAGFVKKLMENEGRGIISTTEAQTLVGANYTTYGAFLDLILACYGHERYHKTLKDFAYIIKESYLSLILASTPETCYKFFANSNIENGLLSRFLAFEINSDNGLKNIDDFNLDSGMKDVFVTNEKNVYRLWKTCTELQKPVFLDITKELKDNVFELYKSFEADVKHVYKFDPEFVKRMLIMHKRLLLIFSALYHFEKYNTFDLDELNRTMPAGWIHNDKLPVDLRAIEIADLIMKSYREAFIRLMFGIDQQRYKRLSISARNDKIIQMKLKGHSPGYLSMLFDLPEPMINAQVIDRRYKVDEDRKNACLDFCRRYPKEKEAAAKMAGVDIRTVQRWCKAANIGWD